MSAHEWIGSIAIRNQHFVDQHNRVLLLRGVNICGSSKLPTSSPEDPITFIGRPFKLNEVDEHFSRLKQWGLTFVRLLVPWESLEHKGVGEYDKDYISYLRQVLIKAGDYGIKCFIDPHQDVWSRMSGGSGAPKWTFDVVGLIPEKFKETGAAYIHEHNDQHMLWPTNLTKLATCTMFTVFFGGNTFCPEIKYKGQTLQDFLQTAYMNCYRYLAECLVDLDCIVGYETMNEPHIGYIGLSDLLQFDSYTNLLLENNPNALQSFALGDGIPQLVEVWGKSWPIPSRRVAYRTLNESKATCWKDGCIWRKQGVWDFVNEKVVLLKPNYFCVNPTTGDPVNFQQDFFLPFIKRFTEAIHSVAPNAIIFVDPIPQEHPPVWPLRERTNTIAFAPHWYDLKSVFTKSFNGFITHDVQGLSRGTKNILNATFFGMTGAKKNYRGQIANVVRHGRESLGPSPTIIGECGIPMDMNEKRAFETGDYTHHTNFLDAVISAIENNLCSFTLWNYNPGNDNVYGDHWNGEDFSIFSNNKRYNSLNAVFETLQALEEAAIEKLREFSGITTNATNTKKLTVNTNAESPSELQPLKQDLMPSPTSPFDITCMQIADFDHRKGGRALDAAIRPFAAKIAGMPTKMNFDLDTLVYTLEFVQETPFAVPTEIFVPNHHYAEYEIEVIISDGSWNYDREKQTVYFTCEFDAAKLHTFTVKAKGYEGNKRWKCPACVIQ